MTRSFEQKCERPWLKGKHVCVGLDPDMSEFPTHLKNRRNTEQQIYDFLKAIVDSTGKVAAAFKPNYAFFEKYGDVGVKVYVMICQYIKTFHEDVVLICDAKRGDIGNTNIGTADFFFERCAADVLTVHGYMGPEALEPFLYRNGQGVFVLCRTSNPGSGEFQDRQVLVSQAEAERYNLPSVLPSQEMTLEESRDYHREKKVTYHMPLYQLVAARVSDFWNKNHNCGLVTGATYPEEIGKVRQVAPDLALLIPGIGKQGGDLEKSVRAARFRFYINLSSAVSYASPGEDFAEAALAKTLEVDGQIRAIMQQNR